jgi:hypothetical protein
MRKDFPESQVGWILKRPARALRIYFKGGRKDAITEMCIGCVGTSQEAKLCECTDCPLWPFRPGATKGEVPAHVPAESELQALADAKVPDAVREHARKLGESRKGSG